MQANTTEAVANLNLWEAVDALIDSAPSLADLRSHRLHLLAACRWRALGLMLPPGLIGEERHAILTAMITPLLLERIRDSCDGPLVLFKGPEVAARYPDPATRSYGDVDLLVTDAEKTQRQLLAAGFEEVGEPELFENIHHLRPLVWPDIPLRVEIHHEPKWIEGLEPPRTGELVSAAVPSKLGIDGVMSMHPVHHVLTLVAHSWAHEPLTRLLHLVDIAAMAEPLDRTEIARTAERWQLDRVWSTTETAIVAAVYRKRTPPLAMRIWARNLRHVRGRTVLEAHLQRWTGPLWALTPRNALRAGASSLANDLMPAEGESWATKLTRMRLATLNAFSQRADHDQDLEERGLHSPARRHP